MKLVFATNNQNKRNEVQRLIDPAIELLTLNDINCTEELPETTDTIKGNALDKARYVYNKYKIDCFADDTGLEIDALNGKPGAMAALYAGAHKDANDNMNKVLDEMKNKLNRKALFKTVIALIVNGKEHIFEGIVSGEITFEKQGEQGFGYDPIFKPEGYTTTFAQMSLIEKNKISHRAMAVGKLVNFLNHK